MKTIKLAMILCCSLILTGCLSPVQTNMSSYVINTLPDHVPQKSKRSISLLVLPPDTRPIYNTNNMAYTIKPFQISYFSHNQWGETPSQMFLPLIVQTLQSTHHYHAVVTPPYAGRYSYSLSTQILKLQQNFLRCPNMMEVTMRVQLTNASTNQVVSTRVIAVAVPIRCRTPYSGVIAANRATAEVLRELADFCIEHS